MNGPLLLWLPYEKGEIMHASKARWHSRHLWARKCAPSFYNNPFVFVKASSSTEADYLLFAAPLTASILWKSGVKSFLKKGSYFHAITKSGLISETFLFWIKSPKKRCQITALSTIHLKRKWLGDRFGIHFCRCRPK